MSDKEQPVETPYDNPQGGEWTDESLSQRYTINDMRNAFIEGRASQAAQPPGLTLKPLSEQGIQFAMLRWAVDSTRLTRYEFIADAQLAADQVEFDALNAKLERSYTDRLDDQERMQKYLDNDRINIHARYEPLAAAFHLVWAIVVGRGQATPALREQVATALAALQPEGDGDGS